MHCPVTTVKEQLINQAEECLLCLKRCCGPSVDQTLQTIVGCEASNKCMDECLHRVISGTWGRAKVCDSFIQLCIHRSGVSSSEDATGPACCSVCWVMISGTWENRRSARRKLFTTMYSVEWSTQLLKLLGLTLIPVFVGFLNVMHLCNNQWYQKQETPRDLSKAIQCQYYNRNIDISAISLWLS